MNERTRRWFATLTALVFCLAFVGLGTWQLARLRWKSDLIRRVDSRIHAPAVPAPDHGAWTSVNARDDEYRHVSVTGWYLNDRSAWVQAVTTLGGGYWLITPMRATDGDVILVNRGFVPHRGDLGTAPPATGTSAVYGLLRISEPGGAFLRHNDPAAGRWYSRDVAAIARAQGLMNVAPFFVDADAATVKAAAATYPVGGLTVVSFHNNHLVYSITWYALALMAGWGVRMLRRTPSRA